MDLRVLSRRRRIRHSRGRDLLLLLRARTGIGPLRDLSLPTQAMELATTRVITITTVTATAAYIHMRAGLLSLCRPTTTMG